MLKISLNKEEISALKQLRLHRTSNIAERAYYVLLSADGCSPPQIARQVGRNAHTIRLWLKRYQTSGIKGLISIKQPGRPGVKAKQLDSELHRLLNRSPSDYGYQEAGWQVNLLKDYFSKQGCQVCDNTVIKALRKLGYVYKRFSKSLPKNALNATEKKGAVMKMVEEIKKESRSSEIFFADESHFSNQPYVQRGWFKRGKKKA